MFRIKICGITNRADALAAVDAGADAVGLNFFARSKRFLGRDRAAEIAAAVAGSVLKVGVFVNHSAQEIAEAVEHFQLDGVQLHGDESAAVIDELPKSVQIVRAYRCGPDGLQPLTSYLAECRSIGRMPDAILLDSKMGDNYGGTGACLDWSLVAKERAALGNIPLILAGGLTPLNVADAIAAVRPDGVDVASGVERQPAIKDHEAVKQFVAAAKRAFGAC